MNPTKPGDTRDSDAPVAGALTRFSLDRRVTVLVLFMSIVVVGIIAALGIPLELFPRGYQGQSIYVWVPWQNAPTRAVLDQLTIPLEDSLNTARGIERMGSFSFMGGCHFFLRFKPGADMAVAYREVRDRIERARPFLPEDADRMFVRKEDPSGIPIAVIGMAIDPTIADAYTLVQKEIVLPFSRIDGVASVKTDGLEQKEIIIEVDKQRAEGYGLNLYQLAQELGADNFTMASGTVREAGKEYLLRSVASYGSLEELEQRPINGRVRLKDIANVRYEEAEKRYAVRVNSRPAVAAVLFKEGEANTVETCSRIEEQLARMKKNPRLSGVYMESIFNQGKLVEESIQNLVNGGKIGGSFAAIVLFLFLRRFRLTGIITLSIPVSILIALVAMFFMGETLNLLTILALVICVGLLVDNSVVVAENIHRHFRDGLAPRQACIQGAGEIALAITLSTLTTVIVFLPAALVQGEAQFFLMRLALPITVSLLASLVVALVFIPLCVYLTMPGATARPNRLLSEHHQRLTRALQWLYDVTFGNLNQVYNRALALFLTRRFDLVVAVILVFALTQAVAVKKVKIVPHQEEDSSGFTISVEPSNEYSFEDLKDYFREIEQILEKRQKEFELKGYFLVHGPRGGRLEGWFEPERKEKRSPKDVVSALLKEIPEKPGIKLRYGREDNSNDPEKMRAQTFTVRLEGDDPVQLDSLATALEDLFARVDGVVAIRMGTERSPSELALVVERDRTSVTAVNPVHVAGVVGYALRGAPLPKFNYEGVEVPVRVRFREQDRQTLADLWNFAVPTQSGATLPLSTLTVPRFLNTPRSYFRENKRLCQNITLELDPKKAQTTVPRLIALQNSLDLPEGVTTTTLNQSLPSEELASIQFAAILSVVFIYLLMGFLFESFLLPLSILCTIPLAGIGVVWIHYFTGKNLDFLGMVGCVLLIGVVVNNGIVLVDYINRLRSQGIDRSTALLRAAERRFRPIIMTALTTIIGMVPLTLSGPSQIGLSYKSFGLTLIGGMSVATLLTLLVIPVFYTLIDDVRLFVSTRFAALIRSRHRSTEEAVTTESRASGRNPDAAT